MDFGGSSTARCPRPTEAYAKYCDGRLSSSPKLCFYLLYQLVWVWFSFAFGFTSILTWLILLTIAGFSGINLFSYFATQEIPKLKIKTGSNELVIDLMSKTALSDSEEIINFIYSQSAGIGIPISIDNY